jgi:signal transduction histidine kinase/ActR/RegA family two-component response regulator
VRVAQSVAIVQQLGARTVSIVGMMVLGLAAQLQGGFGWRGLAWQCAMATLACLSFANWQRLRRAPQPASASERYIRNLVIFAGLCGAFWCLGLVMWASAAQPQLALLAVAVSMMYTLHATATCHLLPWAAVAFSAPLIAGSVFVCLSALQAPVAQIGVSLIALQAAVCFWLLRTNWIRFAHSIDLDFERSNLAAMLQEQKEIAEKAVQLKTRFLASASHDLRQPMHAISLYLDGLAELDLPDRVRRVVSDARVCAHDMNDMFRSLLDISRLDAQQAVPALSPFSIGGVLSRVEKEFTPLANSRGIQLKIRPCAHSVYSDPVMVERIALNFVSNAVRHTTSGRVLVGCRLRGRAVRLCVYDTGAGIPESEQQTIFDEFRTLDATRPHDHTGGLGLGLAIVRRLSQALRLQIIVRSKPGSGSMFAVDLPLVHVARTRAQSLASAGKLEGRLAVVVDDEPSILQAASFILETAGCEVIGARSGDDAMQSLANSTRVPDVIICDYELNDTRNGSDVIRDVREEFNCDIPALLVTGNTAGGTAEKSAKELGIPVLFKPLEAQALKGALEALLTIEGR